MRISDWISDVPSSDLDDQARRAADADVGARLLVTGDIDGRTIGQVQGDLVGTVGPGSVYPTQAIGPAQVVVAAGFRGVQHVDDVAGARIATCFTTVARQHLECDALVLLDAVDRCRGAVDLDRKSVV